MKEYRISEGQSADLNSRQIVERVVFAISEDAPDFSDDAQMSGFLVKLNPVLAAVYCAWMSAGFIANGGLFNVYETCCAEMIQRAAYGFRLLGKADVAHALEMSCRAFPNNQIPDSRKQRLAALDDWNVREGRGTESLEQKSLRDLEYKFVIQDTYDHADELLQNYRYEFLLSDAQ